MSYQYLKQREEEKKEGRKKERKKGSSFLNESDVNVFKWFFAGAAMKHRTMNETTTQLIQNHGSANKENRH